MKLSAIILTRNEERNIRDCLVSLAWADEILVVDSGSTDKTVAVARQNGACVIPHEFVDFASQRNFAMQQARGDWVLFVDADERVTPELAGEIRCLLGQGLMPCVYRIPRRNFFFGHRLRFGDACRDAPPRFFPRNRIVWKQPVHEEVTSELPFRSLENPLLHYSTRDWEHYRAKMRCYLPLELETMRKKGVRPGWKNVLLRPIAKFYHLYFWRLGILDGIAGLQYAILSAQYTAMKHWRYFKNESRPR